MRLRIAAFGCAMQLIFADAEAADFHLAAVKFSFADNANALVVERPPFSESIFSAQDREAIVEFRMCDHKFTKSSLLIAIETHNRAGG